MDSFTPLDNTKEDSEHHLRITAETHYPPNTEDDRMFTSEEVEAVILNMDKNKAPGMDGITADILLHVFKALPLILTVIYNGCLRTGNFPQR